MNMKTTWMPVERVRERSSEGERSLDASRHDEIAVVVALLSFMVLFFYTVFVS